MVADENSAGGMKGGFVLGSLFAALPKEIRWAIGALLVYFLFLGGFMVLGKLPSMLESKCWELQFTNDRVFRFNACNGTTVELDKNTLEPKKEKR